MGIKLKAMAIKLSNSSLWVDRWINRNISRRNSKNKISMRSKNSKHRTLTKPKLTFRLIFSNRMSTINIIMEGSLKLIKNKLPFRHSSSSNYLLSNNGGNIKNSSNNIHILKQLYKLMQLVSSKIEEQNNWLLSSK